MRTILIAALATLAAGASTTTIAGERTVSGENFPASSARAEIRKSLEELGYRVSHVEDEHGRLELRAVNDTGLPIKLTYDPATGEMLRAALR
ncbi:PepSY domain-containing protein [Alsobacter soli]|nr:PepSY domain-containing protein [Alsobacter soli]